MHVCISNPGGTDVQDVVLSEAAAGDLYTFAVIPAGGSVERTFRFDVKQSCDYAFCASYADAGGGAIRLDAAPVEITIAADGVLPEGAKNSFIEFTGNSIKIGGSSIFAALLISGVAVLIVLLLIASRRARMGLPARTNRKLSYFYVYIIYFPFPQINGFAVLQQTFCVLRKIFLRDARLFSAACPAQKRKENPKTGSLLQWIKPCHFL